MDGLISYREGARRTLRLFGHLLPVHIVFALLGAIVLWPIFAFALRLAIRISGEPALTDFDIAGFVLSPMGGLTSVLLAAVFIAILTFEFAALMIIDVSDRFGLRIGPLRALKLVAWQAQRVLFFCIHLVLRMAVVMAPGVILALVVAYNLLTKHDINYYLAERPPEFWTAAVLIGAIIVILALLLAWQLLRWSLALPLVLFSKVSPRNSFGQSAAIVRSRKMTVLTAFFVWAIVALVVQTMIAGALYFAVAEATRPFESSLNALAIALGVALAIALLVRALVDTFVNGSISLTAIELLVQSKEELTLPPGSAAGTKLPQGENSGHLGIPLVGIAFAAFIAAGFVMRNVDLDGPIEVIAHRAGATHAPENTLAAIDRAIEDGADWIEIDVQETADGTVVLLHDRDLMRVGARNLDIHNATDAELVNIDVGSFFSQEFSGERVPTLADALDHAKDKVNVLIELKYYGFEDSLEERVVEIVEAASAEDQVAFMSLKLEGVTKLSELRPDWRMGLLTARAIGDLTELGVSFLAVNTALATAMLSRRAHSADQDLLAWTVNTRSEMANIASRGVDGLITDEPALALSVISEWNDLSPPAKLLLIANDRLGL